MVSIIGPEVLVKRLTSCPCREKKHNSSEFHLYQLISLYEFFQSLLTFVMDYKYFYGEYETDYRAIFS